MDQSLTISSANQADEKVLMKSTHSTVSTPEEILAPKPRQGYHSTETPPIHMSASSTTSVLSNNDNKDHIPLFEKHYQNTENDDDTTSTMTPPDRSSFPSLNTPKPDVKKTTAQSHDTIIITIATTNDLKNSENHHSTMEPIHKKKSIRSRFKDALNFKSSRHLKNVYLESPATFSIAPSSSTPTPTLQSPLLDKRHSTSSSLLDHSKITLLKQKHDNKAKSWHPPSTFSQDRTSGQHAILPIEHDDLNDLGLPSLPTTITVDNTLLSSTLTPDLDDSPPVPTSRFLTAFQKLCQQKPTMDTISSSSSKRRSKEEKQIPPHSTNSSKSTISLADKIKTRFKHNGIGLKPPVTTSSSRLQPSELSSKAQSWSTFSQSFVPSCSVNYASHRQNRQKYATTGTPTSLKQQKVQPLFDQQKHKVQAPSRSSGQVSSMFDQQKYNTLSKAHAPSRSAGQSQHINNKRSSQQYNQKITPHSPAYSMPVLAKLGHNKPSRLSAPPTTSRCSISTENWNASLDRNMSPSSQLPSITNTTSFGTLSTTSSASKAAHMNSNKPSLSSSSSFSTSSTASCSSTSYLSTSSTHSNKKSNGIPISPIPVNPSLSAKHKMKRSPGMDRLENNQLTLRTNILPNQSKTLLGDRLKKKKKKLRVRFLAMTTVQDTFSKNDYDRASDPYAVCTRLTASLAQQIKEELNTFKLEEMKIHSLSRCNTQFFL